MKKGPANEYRKKEKRELYKVRVSTQIHGSLKNDFIDDCILRGCLESKLLKSIIDLHYEIMNIHQLKGKEFSDVKKVIIAKALNQSR